MPSTSERERRALAQISEIGCHVRHGFARLMLWAAVGHRGEFAKAARHAREVSRGRGTSSAARRDISPIDRDHELGKAGVQVGAKAAAANLVDEIAI